MLQFIPHVFKTKKMCKNAVKKLPFVTKQILAQYKTQEMCDKVILENGRTLMVVLNCCKNERMCNEGVDN